MSFRLTFLSLLTVFVAIPAIAHPLPDLPIRTYFSDGGEVEIRVEIDPRSFDKDPEALDYFLKENVDQFEPSKVEEMKKTATEFVGQRLRFLFEPMGEVRPEWSWEFRKLGDEDWADPKAETVFVGSWKTTLAQGISAYRVESKKLTEASMGMPLNVLFINYLNGEQAERYAVLFPGETSFALDLNAALSAEKSTGAPEGDSSGLKADSGDWFSIFRSEIKRGFLHVVPLGLDHILFVLGVFLMTRKAKPLLLQITAFTIAHTLTLWLASAGIVNLPANVVEPVIAASIVVIAIENIFHKQYSHWRLLVVFAFGLIHGLGFAGVMSTRLDSTASLVVGLLGINVGVELGQLFVIAIAFIATIWIAKNAVNYRKWVVVPGSIIIALAGVWWVIERTLL